MNERFDEFFRNRRVLVTGDTGFKGSWMALWLHDLDAQVCGVALPPEQFGEIYFSYVYPGAVRAWHVHKKMTLNYAVPVGRVKLVLYDDRESSPTRGNLVEIFTGPEDYKLITIPPRIWNGFKGIGPDAAIVANCSTLPHEPDEIERLDPFSDRIPYDWALRHG